MASLALYLTTFTFYAVATGIHLSPILWLTFALVCTITAIFLPNWLVYSSTHNLELHISYGLTKHCSSYQLKTQRTELIR
jgi:branched-subunit amino acid transport protein